ncbi:TetR/AcrR family transcriptional regulator [Neobacillus jeddahensis]|uniref:TetR/AcrR family transcriptional regulator n=1 Tax=Neobacillus jeddahensis TaxID=1461580 RepID=UPI00058FFF92|nr:TetR/AcrR family transcriptional regulator [Neobacillus jeddahensis]
MPDGEDKLVGEFPFFPKQERAQQKRKALIDSGYALFNSKGYDLTTAKEIASHAGVATGTFYRYFSDKRQLLLSLLEDKLENFLPPEPSWIAGDPETVLISLLETHYKRLEEVGLHRVLPELIAKDPELADVLGKARRKIHESITSGLQQAQEQGLTWSDMDVDTLSWAIMVLVENGPDKENQCGRKIDCKEMASLICRMVFPPEVLKQLRKQEIEIQE